MGQSPCFLPLLRALGQSCVQLPSKGGTGDGAAGKTEPGLRVTRLTARETDSRVLSQGSGPVITRTWWVEESRAGSAGRESSRQHSGARERCGARDTRVGVREVSSGGTEPPQQNQMRVDSRTQGGGQLASI